MGCICSKLSNICNPDIMFPKYEREVSPRLYSSDIDDSFKLREDLKQKYLDHQTNHKGKVYNQDQDQNQGLFTQVIEHHNNLMNMQDDSLNAFELLSLPQVQFTHSNRLGENSEDNISTVARENLESGNSHMSLVLDGQKLIRMLEDYDSSEESFHELAHKHKFIERQSEPTHFRNQKETYDRYSQAGSQKHLLPIIIEESEDSSQNSPQNSVDDVYIPNLVGEDTNTFSFSDTSSSI